MYENADEQIETSTIQ